MWKLLNKVYAKAIAVEITKITLYTSRNWCVNRCFFTGDQYSAADLLQATESPAETSSCNDDDNKNAPIINFLEHATQKCLAVVAVL